MTENFDHSSVCLQVYYDRGHKALLHLQQGLVDDALEDLRQRKASFFNFKVADFNLEKTGGCAADSRELHDLWLKIARQDKALKSALQDALGQLSGELRRIKVAKKSLASFKSSHQSPSQFVKQV